MWHVVNWQDVAKRYEAAKVPRGRAAARPLSRPPRRASCLVIVFSTFTGQAEKGKTPART